MLVEGKWKSKDGTLKDPHAMASPYLQNCINILKRVTEVNEEDLVNGVQQELKSQDVKFLEEILETRKMKVTNLITEEVNYIYYPYEIKDADLTDLTIAKNVKLQDIVSNLVTHVLPDDIFGWDGTKFLIEANTYNIVFAFDDSDKLELFENFIRGVKKTTNV